MFDHLIVSVEWEVLTGIIGEVVLTPPLMWVLMLVSGSKDPDEIPRVCDPVIPAGKDV